MPGSLGWLNTSFGFLLFLQDGKLKRCLANFLLWVSNQWLGSMVWDPQRQQALRMDGIIIIVIIIVEDRK
jgi:hypothetical protein